MANLKCEFNYSRPRVEGLAT